MSQQSLFLMGQFHGKPFVKQATGIFAIADNFSNKIKGHQVGDYCKMQAAYLCKLIYRFPPGSQGFSTSFPDEVAKAAANWDIWQDFNHQNECGFVARLFKPKGYDPYTNDDGQMCSPTFVFRGTDFDDFRGLGVVFNFTWPGLNEALKKGVENFENHLRKFQKKALSDAINPFQLQHPPGRVEKVIDFTAVSYVLHELKNVNIDEILAAILNQPWIFETDRNNPDKKAEYKPEDWEAAVEGQLPGSLDIGGLGERAQASLDFKIIVRKEKNFGDWATNLLQGVGVHTLAYEYATDVMNTKIKYT